MDEQDWREAMEARMERHEARMAEIDGYIEATDTKLVAIGRQNAALSEMVEVLGGYVAAVIDVAGGKQD